MNCKIVASKSLDDRIPQAMRALIKERTWLDCETVEDLPKELNLHSFFPIDLVDVSVLGAGGVEYLDLTNFTSVTDVSALGESTTLRHLVLRWCIGVVDVSALGTSTTLQHLDLTGCVSVTDVSALGTSTTLRKLILRRCTGVTDVSALGKVKELDLSACTGVTDVSALSKVENLILWGCTGVTDFSAVPHAQLEFYLTKSGLERSRWR